MGSILGKKDDYNPHEYDEPDHDEGTDIDRLTDSHDTIGRSQVSGENAVAIFQEEASEEDDTSSTEHNEDADDMDDGDFLARQQTHVSYISHCSDVQINPSTENHYTFGPQRADAPAIDAHKSATGTVSPFSGPSITVHTNVSENSKVSVKPTYQVHQHVHHHHNDNGRQWKQLDIRDGNEMDEQTEAKALLADYEDISVLSDCVGNDSHRNQLTMTSATLQNVSMTAAHQEEISNVLMSMKTHPGQATLQENGCRKLFVLSFQPELKEYIHKTGGTDVILAAIRTHPRQRAVQEWGCLALADVSLGMANIKKYIFENGGIDHILLAMSAHPGDCSVQDWACRALAALAFNMPQIQRYIFFNGGVDVALTSMERYEDQISIQVAGLAALVSLSYGFPDVISFLHQPEQLYKITSTIKKNMGESAVQELGLKLLGLLCTSKEAGERIHRNEGVDLVLSAMHRHHDSIGVQRTAVEALFIFLDKVSGLSGYVQEREGISAVISILKGGSIEQASDSSEPDVNSIPSHILQSTKMIHATFEPSFQNARQVWAIAAFTKLDIRLVENQSVDFADVFLSTIRKYSEDDQVQFAGIAALTHVLTSRSKVKVADSVESFAIKRVIKHQDVVRDHEAPTAEDAPDIQRYICDNGGVDQLLSAMEKHAGVWRVQANGCLALANICQNVPDLQRYVFDKGGLQAILFAMKRHDGEWLMQVSGCAALALISQRAPDIQKYLFENGGVDQVISAMRQYNGKWQMQTNGCLALTLMSESAPEIQMYICNNGGVDQVLTAMKIHEDEWLLQANGCSTLADIVQGAHDIQNYIFEKGGVKQVLVAMNKHDTAGLVQAKGCLVLAHISYLAPDIQKCICIKGGVGKILSAMKKHDGDWLVQDSGCLALGYLSQNFPEIHTYTCIHRALDQVLSAMERHGDALPVQSNGCLAIANMSNNMPGIQIFHNGGLDPILSPMERYSDYWEVSANGCRALALISQDVPYIQNYIRNNGGVDLVLSTMKKHSSVWQVQAYGCLALAYISHGLPEIQKYIYEKGGVDQVLSTVDQHDNEKLVWAFGRNALTNISQDFPDLQSYICDKGGKDLLFRTTVDECRNPPQHSLGLVDTAVKMLGDVWQMQTDETDALIAQTSHPVDRLIGNANDILSDILSFAVLWYLTCKVLRL